jgi:putative ABC transport system permease protein
MTTLKIVLKELFERKSQLITSFLPILLGITVIVSIKTITYFSQNAVAEGEENTCGCASFSCRPHHY